MTTTGTVARASVWVATSSLITRMISFVSLPLLLKILSVSAYGELILLFSIATPVNTLSSFGTEDTVLTDTSRSIGAGQWGRARALLFDYVIVRTGITAVLILLGFVFQSIIVQYFGDVARTLYFYVALYVFANTLRGIQSLVLQVSKDFRAISTADIAEALARFAFFLFFLWKHELNLTTALASYALAKYIGFLFAFFPLVQFGRTLAKYPGDKHFDLFAIIRRHAKWDVVRSILGQLSSRLDIWSVALFVGSTGVGLLSAAQNIVSAAFTIFPLARIMAPITAAYAHEKLKMEQVMRRSSKYSLIFLCLLSVVLIFILHPVLQRFLPKYLPAELFVLLLLPRNIITPIGSSEVTALLAYHEQRYIFLISNIGTISSLTFLPLFAWLFGVYGVILEGLVSTLTMYVAREVRLRRKHGIATFRIKDVFEFDSYDRWVIQKFRSKIRRTSL